MTSFQTKLRVGTAIATFALGCSSVPAEGTGGGSRESQIIGGVLDTTHQAVVALTTDQSMCAGTIIHVNPSTGTGLVLTAAHCADLANPPDFVVQGDNFETPDRTYTVMGFVAHPEYAQVNDVHTDFGLVRFAGADAQTPTMPYQMSEQDGLALGEILLSIGYGRTNYSNQPDPHNEERRQVDLTVSQLQPGTVIASISAGGFCQGDSGGPLVFGGAVVAVASAVSGNCDGSGFGSRLGRVADSFIAPVIAALPACGVGVPGAACEDCNQDRCCNGSYACSLDPDCVACAESDPATRPANCSSITPWRELDACLRTLCADDCGFSGGAGAGGAGVGGTAAGGQGTGGTGGLGPGGSGGSVAGAPGGAAGGGGVDPGTAAAGGVNSAGFGASAGSAGGAGLAGSGGLGPGTGEAGVTPESDDGGCVCSAPGGARSGSPAGVLFALSGLVLVATRRRRSTVG